MLLKCACIMCAHVHVERMLFGSRRYEAPEGGEGQTHGLKMWWCDLTDHTNYEYAR